MATLPGGQETGLVGLTEEEQEQVGSDIQGMMDDGALLNLISSPEGDGSGGFEGALMEASASAGDDSGNVNIFQFTPPQDSGSGDDVPAPRSMDLPDNLTGLLVDDQGGGNTQFNLMGNTGDNVIQTGLGNDSLSGGDGSDSLYGGGGDDAVFDVSGDNSISGGIGSDFLFTGDGSDALDGGTGDDLIFAGGGDDSVAGGEGNDSVSGGAGEDSIFGGAGDDSLSGGDDADVFFFEGGFGSDTVQDFAPGEDTIDLSVLGTSFVEINSNVEYVDGNGVISFPDGSTLTLDGVDSIDEDWFVV